jgi:hypothetical protein
MTSSIKIYVIQIQMQFPDRILSGSVLNIQLTFSLKDRVKNKYCSHNITKPTPIVFGTNILYNIHSLLILLKKKKKIITKVIVLPFSDGAGARYVPYSKRDTAALSSVSTAIANLCQI